MNNVKAIMKTFLLLSIAIVAYLMLTGRDPVAVGNKMVDVVVRRDPSELVVGRWIPESYQGKPAGNSSAVWEFYADGSVEKFDFMTTKGTWHVQDGRLSWSIGRVLYDQHFDFKVNLTNDSLTLTEGIGALSEIMNRNGHPYILKRE